MQKQTVLLGKGTLAIRIAEWFLRSPDHKLMAVVPVVPEPRWTDSLIGWAESHGVPYVASGHYKNLMALTGDRPIDLAFSVFYDKIIRAWFIERCGRILNLHNSPLPRYRGVSPINWALKNNEIAHGVTIHEITPGIDDGPVVAQLQYSIYPEFDEVRDVYARALEYGWVLFQQTMPLLDQITARPQDHALATYYSARENDLLGERRGFTRHESLAPRA
ncbi:MAG TPA: formyltransferase family protein [Roseiflexaceae bacterium]|nr:formyltransferase family protein [Roseiflexaceae bacterium]